MKPLCSICIPTLNRAPYLEIVLNSIVSQKIFIKTQKIEIVISDNASTDNTKDIIQPFLLKYGNKIRYIRNKKKLSAMENFYNVFKAGRGNFLKLCNDTCEFLDNSLEEIISSIENNKKNRPVLFFLNSGKNDNILCKTLDEYIQAVSYFNTWSVSFGLWQEDLSYLSCFIEKSATQIAQTYILFKMMFDGKAIFVNDKVLFKIHHVGKKDGYNIAEVFGYNYLNILKEFVDKGKISSSVYGKEKKKILLEHINYFYFDLKKEYNFAKNGYFKWLWQDYKFEPYFYANYLKMRFKQLKNLLGFIISFKKQKTNGCKIKTLTIFGVKIKMKSRIKK